VADVGFELRGPGTPLGTLLAELWRARNVLWTLARKDFHARYRRTMLGLLWAVGLPLVQAAVLAVVFTHIVHFASALKHLPQGANIRYPVFVYAAITVWSFFSTIMPIASTAIVDNGGLARKIYFPRALFPLLAVASGVYPLAISLGVLFALTLGLQHSVSVSFLWVIPGGLLTLAITAGFGLLLSALHVYFRDVRFIVQAIMSVLFYLSPVIYAVQSAPHALRNVVGLGPMSGPIELMRLAIGAVDPNWPTVVGYWVLWFAVTTGLGLLLQSRYDRVFVDLM
jgi:lipopolysaccharide transport system permease protein